jgi:hypothetical protein
MGVSRNRNDRKCKAQLPSLNEAATGIREELI